MKRMFKIVIFFLILYVVSAIVLYFVQEKIIFQGVKLPPNFKYTFQQEFEEVTIKTEDNNTINALHFKVNNPKGIILYFHGNMGNLDRWGTISSDLIKYNFDVFVMDYRNYGKSTGEFNEAFMFTDAQRCYEYVKTKFSEDKITLYGRSLGCTFATKVASKNNPKQLILESPFYNLTDVASYHYPFMPFNLLMKYKFESNKFIKEVSCKTIIFHGTHDKVVPFESGKKLYNTAHKKQTTFISIPNGTHHNLNQFELYEKTLLEML